MPASRSSRGSSRTATRTASPATPALPTNLNPYLAQFGNPVLAAAAIRPLAGSYDIVFDSAAALGRRSLHVPLLGQRHAAAVPQAHAGPRSPQPPARRARIADLGSGIDATTIKATIDGKPCQTTLGGGQPADPDDRRQAREAPAPAPGVRLPGVAQHGERGADPAQHAGALGRDRAPLDGEAG